MENHLRIGTVWNAIISDKKMQTNTKTKTKSAKSRKIGKSSVISFFKNVVI